MTEWDVIYFDTACEGLRPEAYRDKTDKEKE